MKKLTILVDMDDVLEDLLPAWVEYLNCKYGCRVRLSDITGWDMRQFFPQLRYDELYGALFDDALWSRVKPKRGAQEYVRRLIDDGHQVFVVTASHPKTIASKMEKVLFRYFPYRTWDNVIVTSKKQMIQGDVLVDDGPHNLAGGAYHKILMDAPHNQDVDVAAMGAVRAMSWRDVYRFICELSEKGVIYGSY